MKILPSTFLGTHEPERPTGDRLGFRVSHTLLCYGSVFVYPHVTFLFYTGAHLHYIRYRIERDNSDLEVSVMNGVT